MSYLSIQRTITNINFLAASIKMAMIHALIAVWDAFITGEGVWVMFAFLMRDAINHASVTCMEYISIHLHILTGLHVQCNLTLHNFDAFMGDPMNNWWNWCNLDNYDE